MRKKLIVGNWKMKLSVPESTILVEKIKKNLKSLKNAEVVVCPGFLAVYPASIELQSTKIKLGAQNMFYEEVGAFTGEVSPVELSHFVQYVILGHSERRMYFGESDKNVAKKAEAAFANAIIPIICIGETLHEKEEGLSKVVVMNQLETALSHLTASEVAESVIAYEPVWAISSNQSLECKPAYVEKMSRDIRNLIKALYGQKASETARIIYGGNVNQDNVDGFAKSKEIDGVLVGAASIDSDNFTQIVKTYEILNPGVKSKKTVRKVGRAVK